MMMNMNRQQFRNFNGINAASLSATTAPVPNSNRVSNNMNFNKRMNNGLMHFNQIQNNWNNVVFIAAPNNNNANDENGNRRKLGKVRESVNKNSNSRTSKGELFVKKFVPASSTSKGIPEKK